MPLPAIPFPDVRKPGRMPSLPEWVDLRVQSMRDESQPSLKDGKYRMVTTLPANLLLTEEQRAEIERYVSSAEAKFKQTPSEGDVWERATLALITELLIAPFRSARLTAVEAEVAGKHYLLALKDVPSWAVEIAIENWICGSCDHDERGEAYDCEWRPPPATLRKVTLGVLYPLHASVRTMRRLLVAEELIEFDEEHRVSMCARIAGLIRVNRI